MADWLTFLQQQASGGTTSVDTQGRPRVDVYDSFDDEYRALSEGLAVVDRSRRGLLEITGADRAPWLHNLTSNQVTPLEPGAGNYAFALNVQGRILFDLNIMVGAESIRLDLDRRFLVAALSHFEKYTITEDVTITDRTEEFIRIGIAGARLAQAMGELGASQAASMPQLGSSTLRWSDTDVDFFRHDFCGPAGVELLLPPELAQQFWTERCRDGGTPAGDTAVETCRIEDGIPFPGSEINEEYLPAETGQFDRAVNYQKGCYLGQEIVERMRSRNVVARRLVGLLCDTSPPLAHGAIVLDAKGGAVGTVTSSCRSPRMGSVVALGYVKSSSAQQGEKLRVDDGGQDVSVVVASLPFQTSLQ